MENPQVDSPLNRAGSLSRFVCHPWVSGSKAFCQATTIVGTPSIHFPRGFQFGWPVSLVTFQLACGIAGGKVCHNQNRGK